MRNPQPNPGSPLALLIEARRAYDANVAQVSSSYYDKLELGPSQLSGGGTIELKDKQLGGLIYLNSESAEWLVKHLTRIFGLAAF